MPFDFMPNFDPENMPTRLDFEPVFEPTKVDGKKYVINSETNEYLAVVGDSFTCASHKDFFGGVKKVVTENLTADECEDMKISWSIAHKNAWAMMNITLPKVTAKIVSDKHETEIAQRIIALHGIDGSCSNQVFFGAIDFFCTNGMIRGEHDKVRRKNTSNFTMQRFETSLRESTQSFYEQSETLKAWAKKPLYMYDVKQALDKLMKSERKVEKMMNLYSQEATVRGQNAWALYSAFTNYSSYADERNGFSLKESKVDSAAVSMFSREHEVAKWIDSNAFKELVAA